MRTADWRVSAVPEIRSILIDEKMEAPTQTLRRVSDFPEHEQASAAASIRDTIAVESRFCKALGAGDMFWVSEDMVALALDAAADLPEFNPAFDLPSRCGFMVLEKPLPGVSTWVFDENFDQVETELGVEVITWVDHGTEMRIESYCRSTGIPKAQGFLEPVWYENGVPDGVYDFSGADAEEGTVKLMSFLAAAALLMSSPGVADRSTVAPKTKAARKDAKKSRSANVTVIDLHTPKHVSTGDVDETGRTYTHRWMVRGHWRNQPHGPNRSKRSVRWIPFYIKGPAGLPLKETERVWAWRR
ncbi:hypothetical protein [Arthrobacter sp. UYCo732]|uniref:hypothetical protein n=1 Tax=Arthrobacter sp. UYCo732 TaxID=3156336 RepID=UPI003393A3BE